MLAPPYDVIDDEVRARLEARSPYNAVLVELGRMGADDDRYDRATRHFDEWLAEGILRVDEEPSFYVYRMGWHDEAGVGPPDHRRSWARWSCRRPRRGGCSPTSAPWASPRATASGSCGRAGPTCRRCGPLSLAEGLTELCQVTGPPVGRATDEDGVHHRLWRITQPGVVSAITEAVGSAPVVIADGHHRYETALAYRDERRAATGEAGDGDFDLLLALVVELSEDQLQVQPIHRILSGLPDELRPGRRPGPVLRHRRR